MLLSDIYLQLQEGELSQIFPGTGDLVTGNGDMPSTQYQKLWPHVKLGLTELHKRFNLRESEFSIVLQPGQIAYPLQSRFAASNASSREPVRYIEDTSEPFTDNLTQVEQIWGTLNERDYEIPQNNRARPDAVRLPRYNNLIIPDDPEKAPWLRETSELRVVYRADHPSIDEDLLRTPAEIEIDLPSTFLEALLYFIAMRVHTPLGGMLGETMSEGNNWAAKFEAEVRELKMLNLEIDNLDGQSMFQSGGWA